MPQSLAAAGIASAAYQRAADAADRRRFPPPGRLADIGGCRMHLLAMGEGTPAVVIVPSLGGTCSNGSAFSAPPRRRRRLRRRPCRDRVERPAPMGTLTLDSMADDLHAALKAAGIGPPYIIAGQSLGGIVARRFQARFPGDVIGDAARRSSHEEQSRRFGWRGGTGSQLQRAVRYRSRILGARRLAASLGRVKAVSHASLAWETVPEYGGAAR